MCSNIDNLARRARSAFVTSYSYVKQEALTRYVFDQNELIPAFRRLLLANCGAIYKSAFRWLAIGVPPRHR
jgi:hypothetical protein